MKSTSVKEGNKDAKDKTNVLFNRIFDNFFYS